MHRQRFVIQIRILGDGQGVMVLGLKDRFFRAESLLCLEDLCWRDWSEVSAHETAQGIVVASDQGMTQIECYELYRETGWLAVRFLHGNLL